MQSHTLAIQRYELGDQFALQRADNEAFINAWVVYRGVDEDFSQSFVDARTELEGVPFCSWVMQAEKRVGGVILLPNGIGDFFLIPPQRDSAELLSRLIPLLRHWSDPTKPILAQGITTYHLSTFEQAGFVLQESRAWMIRPIEPQSESPTSNWQHKPISPMDAATIGKLLHAAFQGGVGEYGRRDETAHVASTNSFLEQHDPATACGQASAWAVTTAGEPVGICLVELHKGLPTIRFVAVLPSQQGQGVATWLLQRALTKLAPHHKWVKLAVTVGNPAMTLYERLGFVAGDVLHQLILTG